VATGTAVHPGTPASDGSARPASRRR